MPGVYGDEPQRLGEQGVVVVEVPGDVGVRAGRGGLPDERAPRAPEDRDALYPPCGFGVSDEASREAKGSRDDPS